MDTIHIAYALDENYAEITSVSIVSVEKNTSRDVCFHIISQNLSQRTIDKLKASAKNVVFHTPEIRIDNFPTDGWLTAAAYYRLFLPWILPNLDKIIWLDGDTIIEGDITDLWDIDISDYYAAAVPMRGGTNDLKARLLGIDVYYGDGVLLLNCNALRKTNINAQIPLTADLLFKVYVAQGYSWRSDQEVFNSLFGANTKPLSRRFNIPPGCSTPSKQYPLQEWRELFEKPLIWHFGGPTKPNKISKASQGFSADILSRYIYYKQFSPYAEVEQDRKRLEVYRKLEENANNCLVIDEYDYLRKNVKRVVETFANNYQEFHAGKKLVLWGCTDSIEQIICYLVLKGIKPFCIVDGMPQKQGTKIWDWTVISPMDIEKRFGQCYILLTMQRREVAGKIAEHLDCENYHLFSELWDEIYQPL